MIEPGARITFVRTKRKGSGFQMSVYEGKMVEYGTMFSRVCMKNGRKILVQTTVIRKVGEKNALTDALVSSHQGN